MHCLRKYATQNIALMVTSCSSNQITPWYQFSLKSDKVNIFSMAAGCVVLLRQPITPTGRFSDNPLLRQPIIPTAHYSDNPLFRQPISPTHIWHIKDELGHQTVIRQIKGLFRRNNIPLVENIMHKSQI